MASNIISETIDEEYPVAGQDNDSQGFRDNFNVIKTGLATANSEITDLQDNSARTDTNNNFLGNQISTAEFVNTSETIFQGGSITAGVELNYTNGHYQVFNIENTDLTLTFTNFPAQSFGKMRVELYGDGTNRTVTFVSPSGDVITDENPAWTGSPKTAVVVSDDTNPVVLEFWSSNGGSTVLGKYLGYFTSS